MLQILRGIVITLSPAVILQKEEETLQEENWGGIQLHAQQIAWIISMRMKTIIAIIVPILIIVACSSNTDPSSDTYGRNEYTEIENPYSEGTGHYAGYEWAERTGGACNGNSNSFNEGCEEYYHQTGG